MDPGDDEPSKRAQGFTYAHINHELTDGRRWVFEPPAVERASAPRSSRLPSINFTCPFLHDSTGGEAHQMASASCGSACRDPNRDCIITDGTVWRLDVGMSRSFDKTRDFAAAFGERASGNDSANLGNALQAQKRLERVLWARRPQVLEILRNPRKEAPTIRILVARHDLRRSLAFIDFTQP
jgi:hypothetical protein